MTVQQVIITLIAAIISGVLATAITITINTHNEKLKLRRELVDDIFGFKYQLTDSVNSIDIYSQGFSKAMNRIPIVFYNEKNVLEAYDKFFDVISISDPKEKSKKSDEALVSFLKELCKASNIKCSNWNDSRFTRAFNIGKQS